VSDEHTEQDRYELYTMLAEWRRFKRRAFDTLVFFSICCGIVGLFFAIMGIRQP
jgi:hypothetical protein